MGAREDTLRLSIFFFLLFTPFSSYMTILTHIYEQADLPGIGPATLATNYICFMLSTIVAPAVKWPLKLQLLLGGFFYTLNYSSGIFADMTDQPHLKFAISCLGSGIAGCSGGFLWVSQGRYIHLTCEMNNSLERKGQMYGLFSSIYCFSNVSAGLLTTFALGFFDSKLYFVIITAIGLLSIVFCLLFLPTLPNARPSPSLLSTHHQEDPEHSEITLSATPIHYPLCQSIKNTLAFIPRMKAVLLMLVIDGLSLAVYSSQITHLIPRDTPQESLNKLAGLSTISLGVGATIGGFLSGAAADRLGGLVSGRICLFVWVISCVTVWSGFMWPALWVAFGAAFLWGFSLFYLEGWMYTICSRFYGGSS